MRSDIIRDLRTPYTRFVDRFFLFLILCLPFERAFIKNGEGAFLQYLVIMFALFTIPLWRRYYSRCHMGIIIYFIFLLVGTFSDWRTCAKLRLPFVALSLRVWIMFYFLLVAYNIGRRNEFYIKRVILCLLIFSVTVAVFQSLGIGAAVFEEKGVEGGRVAVMGANLNSTARDVSLFIIYGFLLFVSGVKMQTEKKWLLILLSIVAFVALIRTGSRGGLFAVFCALPTVVFTTRSMSKKVIYATFVAVVLAIIVVVVINTPAIWDRISKSLDSGDTGGREYIFHLSLYYWSLAKFTGHGCFAYQMVMGPEFGWNMLATHCTYTYALVSAGLVGGSFYYLFLLFMLYQCFKVRFLPAGAFLLMVVIFSLLGGITMNIEFTKWLYIVYGQVIALNDLKNRNKLGAGIIFLR